MTVTDELLDDDQAVRGHPARGLCALLAAGLLVAGCGGGSDSTNPAGTATTPAGTVNQQTSAAPRHPNGGPRSANLPSKGAPDNPITDKTQPQR